MWPVLNRDLTVAAGAPRVLSRRYRWVTFFVVTDGAAVRPTASASISGHHRATVPSQPLHAYLPQDRRRAWLLGQDLPTRCSGAALFSDITGFTQLTELLAQASGQRHGVDELARRINAVHQVLVGEVERWRGSVIAFAGDGMTCWFDDNAEPVGPGGAATRRAVGCAAAMQRAMGGFPELSIKIGIGAGAALRLAVGAPDIQRIDLLAGATVARAVAAENLADAGEVVLDEPAAAALNPDERGVRRESAQGATLYLWRPDAAPAAASAVDRGPSAANPAPPPERVDEPAASLGAEQLRPWMLPFVFERETTSGGLFATNLRPATALFVHVALGLGDGPEEAQALDEMVAHVQRALRPFGGVLLEVSVDAQGTCLYGNFGAAHVHEDDPQRALRAALALRAQFAGLGIEASMGLASGTLCVGGYGGASRRSFGAIGDAVNAAARLMSLARAGEVLVAGRVRQPLADEEFTFEARPPIAVKGKAEPIAVFAATGLQRRRSVRLQEPVATLPMVGREAETSLLAAATRAALAGRGQVVRIVGEAGMGKSRLLAEGVRIARRAGLVGCGGACRLDGLRTPYQVWQGIWTAFFDLDPALPQRRLRQAAEAAVQRLAPEHAEAWPLLGAVLGQVWPDTLLSAALQPRDRKSLLHTLLLRCVHTAAAEAAEDGAGLLLVLEDLHAADPLSLELLHELARGIESLPLLVITAERRAQGETDPLATLALAQRIELRGLAATDVEHIVRAKLAQRFPERVGPVPRELLDRIAARAQGNPFYVEELLDYLHDRGLDPRRPDAVLSLELPSSLHSLVLSRMDRLPATQQNTIKAASVIGREFTVDELHGYCPGLGSPERIAADLAELGRLGFTPAAAEPTDTSGNGRHLFRHLVTQEVAYESIGLDTRARLHGQFAHHLEQQHPGGATPAALAPLLAHHCVRAERAIGRDKACHYLELAGMQAAARFANDEALAHFAKALQWLPEDAAAARSAVLVQRQGLFDLIGRHDAQRDDLDELARLAAVLPAPALHRARAATLRAQLEIELGRYAASRAEARAAIELLDAEPALDGTAAAPVRLDAMLQEAQVMLHTGEAAAARPLLDRVLAMARAHGLAAAEVAALSRIGHVHWHLGDFEQAGRWFDQALSLARAGSDLRLQLNLLNSLGVVAKSRSRFTEAAGHYEAALQMARRIGDRSGEAMLLNNLGSACLAAGNFHDAGLHSQHAARIFAETGETVLHGVALGNCAESQRELGQPERALVLCEQALALLRASGSRPGEALMLENLGLAEAAALRFGAAEQRLREAVQIARDIGAPAREASALLHLGQVLCASGQPEAAAGPLAQAEAIAPALGDQGLVLELAAAQAQWRLSSGEAAAVDRLEPLLAQLLGSSGGGESSPAAGGSLPLALYATALRVLRACGDPRAAALQALSRRELAERARRIPDEATRRSFLGIADHRDLLES